jgi:hypothetical protein
MTITLFASIGFVLAVTAFMSGFIKAAKRPEQQVEAIMQKVNGYLTITAYVVVALLSIADGTKAFYLFAWGIGLALHLLKILLVRKGLAVRYGGYFGALLLTTWVIVVFTHLPG